ncbi:MAG TPA: hypothetical protein VGK23_13160 [Methanomassiliicoccales archaeon]|jgi:hypothetical protein
MNQSGGLKIATIIVMAILGFSTLAVGLQLSSGGTAAVTHNQTATKSGAQEQNQTDSVCTTLTSGITDLTVENSALSDGASLQRSFSGDYDLRGSFSN